MSKRPAWADVSVSAIGDNLRAISAFMGGRAAICAVVKAQAYGHGALPVARAALEAGASLLAVALAEEGRELREGGIKAPILVLGAPQPEEASDFLEFDLEASVFEEAAIRAFAASAAAAGHRIRLHLKVDTGMSRVGCRPEAAANLAALIAGLPGLELAGVYSHFADADRPGSAFAREQLAAFTAALESIKTRGIAVPLRHIANSAGALLIPESRLDLVRLGIAMYGLRPDAVLDFPLAGIRPALTIRARVTRLEEIEWGGTVSYGRTWKAGRRTRVATLPLGYADGYPRAASGQAWAGYEFDGKWIRLPQIGRVCMDMCMFDATGVPGLHQGSELVVAGPGGPSLDELAALAGTINYELACHFGLRLPHRFS